jgi:hypothetical protein
LQAGLAVFLSNLSRIFGEESAILSRFPYSADRLANRSGGKEEAALGKEMETAINQWEPPLLTPTAKPELQSCGNMADIEFKQAAAPRYTQVNASTAAPQQLIFSARGAAP